MPALAQPWPRNLASLVLPLLHLDGEQGSIVTVGRVCVYIPGHFWGTGAVCGGPWGTSHRCMDVTLGGAVALRVCPCTAVHPAPCLLPCSHLCSLTHV